MALSLRVVALLGLATVSLVLGACSGYSAQSVADSRTPVRSLLEVRREHVVIQDYDLSCGAAALATVLNFQHGERLSEQEVARALMQRDEYIARPEVVRIRQGFSLLDLKRYAGSRGYKGVGYGKLTLADLIDLAPVIVPIEINGYKHFVVVRGFVGGRVMLADPAFGNRSMRVDTFEAIWLVDANGLGRIAFVVERTDGETADGDLYVSEDTTARPSADTLRQVLTPTSLSRSRNWSL